eukprot:CAMPEP_0170238626 /NCGR_PEP_ID=MMETSP0116_2-20130129/19069_1 /TAXON_ID=400756 /ORGANISM="Durinskia baltica, Strain CSIRO CS-38" /LENGTH=421 /DNA_ID=CAMNT_0010489441 /DNA_START=85 /DNA_END=1350 /DNA_ORIENTATION=-
MAVPETSCRPRGQREELAARLAAFAVGCLGASSAAKAGAKLGLMGSATEEEFRHLLWHLEVLTRQRAAKLADVSVFGGGGGECAGGAPSGGATTGQRCSELFEAAVRDACGADVTDMFSQLPLDGHGRVDLLRVFGMTPTAASFASARGETAALASEGGDGTGLECVIADFVEQAGDLPRVPRPAFEAAQAQLLQEASEANWATDVSAVNALRAVAAHAKFDDDDDDDNAPLLPTAALIEGVARRCGSKRPALAKSALKALIELACASAAAVELGAAWVEAAPAALTACVAAARGTKLVARVAEEALIVVGRRAADSGGPAVAVRALATCIAAEAGAKVPLPAAVASGLRAVATLAPGLSEAAPADSASAAAEVTAVCREVLGNRRLSPAFSEARAALQALPAVPVAWAEAGHGEDMSVAE